MRNDAEKTTYILPGTGRGRPDEVWPVGHEVEGRYRVARVLGGAGVSGMGVVYILESEDRPYAAKSFQHQYARNISLIQRFLREARTWMLLGFHPHIVNAYFVDIIEAAPYLFMEYIPPRPSGEVTLADYVAAGPLPVEDAVSYAIQCAQGMAYAGRAVRDLVHRDLKPENMLITRDGQLKITDFGLVRCNLGEEAGTLGLDGEVPSGEARPGLTQAGSTFGTPAYMAPEQFREAGSVTAAADIYAFGCSFYEALTGSRLFTLHASTPLEHFREVRKHHLNRMPAPLRERRPDCPPELETVIMRCIEKRPEDRWASFDALSDQLGPIYERLTGRPYVLVRQARMDPAAIAEQVRSLGLLDGYDRAVRFPALRAANDESPYGFHLALASYFRSAGERHEERRQLAKAFRARETGGGYEAARRWAGLLLEDGDAPRARSVIDAYLSERPDGVGNVLGPYVRLCVREGRYDEAERVIAREPPSRRRDFLWADVLRGMGRQAELTALLEETVRTALERIARDLAALMPGDRAGWECRGDRELLPRILELLDSGIDASMLEQVEAAHWPDVTAYPDFSDDLAWLSRALGELAEVGADLSPERRRRYAEAAALLDYPRRLERHLDRDGRWIWEHGALG